MTPAQLDTHRGHSIVLKSGVWLYADTRLPVSEQPDRQCGHCGKPNTPEGHDGCLGELAGVLNACCGHGRHEVAYLQTVDGRRFTGKIALKMALGEDENE